MTGWGTWNPERPAELVHLATGVRLTPVLYSARGGQATPLPPGSGIAFGRRGIEDGSVAFSTEVEGTAIGWRYDLSDPERIGVAWRTDRHGEWGLRFWVVWVVSGPDDMMIIHDRSTGATRAFLAGGDCLSLRAATAPLLVTAHADVEALCAEMDERGYFFLGSRATEGRCLALRFNLEEAPAMHFSASFSQTPERPALPSGTGAPPQPDAPQAALEAVHDVVAWNHVFDAVNNRPVTIATRFWNAQKFGGFGLWLTDTLYNALMWSLFDAGKAVADVEALWPWQTDAGNFPCLVCGNDLWLDRSQPPVASWVVWQIHARSGDAGFLADAYPRLLANHDWWWEKRALGDTGLVAWGTSPEAGDGLYKGTKLAAKNESSMDNLPVHDPAPFDPATGLLQAADVGLNSLLCLDGEILALIAADLGEIDTAARLTARADAHRATIGDRLWDAERQVFANRLATGEFVRPVAPTSFFPLAAGAASEAQTEALIGRWLIPPDKFGGQFVLPSITRDDPAYADNVYWRGRIWAPLNYWTWVGLRRAGRTAEAAGLAEKGWHLFAAGWAGRRAGENYNAETGAITDQPDTDAFYAWGALLPLMRAAQVVDTDPWAGTVIAPSAAADAFGPVETPLGELRIRHEADGWIIARDGKDWLSGTVVGPLAGLVAGDDATALTLPMTAAPGHLRLHEPVAAADIDGMAVLPDAGRMAVPPGPSGRRLTVRLGTRSSA